MKKKLPEFKSDEEFAEFVENNDMSGYIASGELKRVRFNFKLRPKDQLISFRLSGALLATLKLAAAKHKTKYQKLIRHILEENIGKYLK